MKKGIIAIALLVASPALAQSLPPLRIQNAGSSVATRFKLNFVNSGCVDNPVTHATDCTIGGASATAMNYSLIDIGFQDGYSNSAANLSLGNKFTFTKAVTATGVRFLWAASGNKTIKCSMWDVVGGTRVATGTVATTTSGIYTCTFGTPFAVTGVSVNKVYSFAVWENGGTQITTLDNTPTNNMLSGTAFLQNSSVLEQASFYGAGDVSPTSSPGTSQYPVEPLYTVP